jgi:hypothetical protein
MSENKTSQTQHEAAFDPLKIWTASVETWTRLTRDNIDRMQSFYHRDRGPDGKDDDKRDPMAFWNTGVDAWTQLACDGIERLQSFYHQVAEVESAAYERAKKSAKDLGDMMSESVTCAADLTREWQKLGIEAARRSVRAFRSPED